MDLFRMVITALEKKYPEPMYFSIYENRMALLDPIQSIIDKHRLADSRHILAIKR
jgi:hypothetical protein